jgi:transposase
MSRKRKQYTAQEKVVILRRHLLDDVPVSELCEEYGLQPSVFYRWQKQLFEQAGEACFQQARNSEAARLKRRVAELEEKLAKKDEVLGCQFPPVIGP